MLYRGLQTRENWRKPEAVGRGFLLFSSVWKTPVKYEARVFEMASQSAPNCKQKKKENKRTGEPKTHISMWFFVFFCLISAQFVMIINVRVFHNWSLFILSSHNLHSMAFCWFRSMDGLAEDESRRFQSNLKSTQYKDKWTQNLASSVRARILYTWPGRGAQLKIIIFTVCEVSKRSWRTWLVFP